MKTVLNIEARGGAGPAAKARMTPIVISAARIASKA